MSGESDRIAVPTNGRGPHPVAPSPAARASEPAPDPAARSGSDLPLAMSPERLAVGLGIVASLVIIIVGLARRGRSRD
jgi:hypothetical protein